MKKSFLLILLIGLVAISAQAKDEIYTVYNSSSKTLTYYCDGLRLTRSGDIELYKSDGSCFANTHTKVEHIVLDESMQNYNSTSMKYLFSGSGGFTALKDITGLEYLKKCDIITDMSYMFYGCKTITSINVSNLNTTKVKNMDYMFYGCAALTTMDLRSNTLSAVTSMNHMFEKCTALTSVSLYDRYMGELLSAVAMFDGCRNLSSVNLEYFRAPKLQKVSYMFANCASLQKLDFSYSTLAGTVTDASYMFYACSKLKELKFMDYLLGDNTENMAFMFAGTALTEVALNAGDTKLQGLKNVEALFLSCTSLTKVTMPSTMTKLTNMNRMFSNCSALTTISCEGDLSVLSATSSDMFTGCTKLVANNGTKWSSSITDKTYARPDRGLAKPGYFTTVLGPECFAPKELVVQGLGLTSVTLQWTPGSEDQNKWEIIYKKDGGTEQTIVVTTNPYKITGLQSETKYTAKVRAICSSSLKSDVSNTVQFTTATPYCKYPTDVQTKNITPTSVDITFTPGATDQKKWWISVTDKADFYVEETLTEPSYSISGLTPNTTYYILVHAICSETNVSEDEDAHFTTLKVCDQPTNLKVDNITTTTADVSFKAGASDQKKWYYKLDKGGKEGDLTATTFTLTGLQPATDYKLYVRAVCDDEKESQPIVCEFTTIAQSKGPEYVCDFTKKSTAHETFNDASPWGYDNDQWGIYGGANRNGQWPFMEMGGTSEDLTTTNPVYIVNWQQFEKAITAIRVTYTSGSLWNSGMSLESWGLNILDEFGLNIRYKVEADKDAVTAKESTYLFVPKTGQYWYSGYYFLIYWVIANTSDKPGVIQVKKIEFYTDGIPEGIDSPEYNTPVKSTKILRNGQLLILRDGKIYTVTGQKVE